MINTTRLRCMIGWLAITLPWLVLVLSYVSGNGWPPSISMTYFWEPCYAPFMMILGAASILLLCYPGYQKVDDVVNTLAGIFGLGVCLFPCAGINQRIGFFQLDPMISDKIHLICAIGFFALLIINSLFLFVKSNGEKTKKKKIRNIIYRICAGGMILSIASIFILNAFVPYAVWAGEAGALMFFGVSWLTKANYYPWLACESREIRLG